MKKLVYTVFYDTGDWAWVKDADDETMYVGGCVTLGSEWGGEHLVSQSFLDFTKTWLMSLGKISYCNQDNDKFDWESAHQQGIEVAKRLKIELGDQADVRYVRPTEDPSYNHEEGYEVLSNGNILPIRRLWWRPV